MCSLWPSTARRVALWRRRRRRSTNLRPCEGLKSRAARRSPLARSALTPAASASRSTSAALNRRGIFSGASTTSWRRSSFATETVRNLTRDTRSVADEPIVVVSYDPEWPRRFEAERALLERVLAPWLEGGIHHVGSTGIPGLASKPIIDMIAGVRDLEEAREAFDPLGKQSYLYTPHRPGIAHHFSKPSARLSEMPH